MPSRALLPASPVELISARLYLQSTLRLIEHAAGCKMAPGTCPEKLCIKIKNLFIHSHTCESAGRLFTCNICRK